MHGGLVEPTRDARFLKRRTREVRASQAVLRERKARLDASLRRASNWLDGLRLIALGSLGLAAVGFWWLALGLIMGCWLIAMSVSWWQERWQIAVDRVKRRVETCRIELRHLERREIYVPLPGRR